MTKMKAICEAVKLNEKIKEQPQRILYLSKVWGLQQKDIAEIEEIPQPRISMILNTIGTYGIGIPEVTFTEEDIQALHEIPRTILPDVSLLSFVQDMLKIDSWHVFYQWVGTPSQRMAALSYLGIKNMRIGEIFDKTSGTVSVNVKRHLKSVISVERPSRNTAYHMLTFKNTKYETKQTKAF